jgi:hypothetical protein
MTCAAVMVVPLVVPRTRTGTPVVTALAEAELVPFVYVVEDASLTVTFCPPDVDTVKPDVDRLLTVPTVPPEAAPDRALEPPPPAAGAPDAAVAGAAGPGAAEEDVARPAETPITEQISATAAATVHRRLALDRKCRPARVPPELPAPGAPDVVRAAEGTEGVSSGFVGS